MNFENLKYVYLLGIGGIGMSALARYFNAMGKTVAGYDRTSTELTSELIAENIAVHFTDDIKNIPSYLFSATNDDALVIYTPAIPNDSAELIYLKSKFTIYKRSQVLGFITQNSNTIAVAGTHGKTTTSTLIAHMLHESGINCSAFLGGIAKNFNSNFVQGDFKKPGHVVVVEADEFDRSFLTLFPQSAIVTSYDADHLDIYNTHDELKKSYNIFASQIKSDGLLVKQISLELNDAKAKTLTYSLTANSDVKAENISISNHEYVFDYASDSANLRSLTLGIPGRYNIENAIAAIAIALHYGLNESQIRSTLKSYSGVKRRFDYQIRSEALTFIDDYAHHPEELRAVISSVKELYAGKKITVVFQPHLFSRTKDFANEFASSLSLADNVLLLPIYPAREKPMEGVTSEIIFRNINTQKKICGMNEAVEIITKNKPEVLLTLGAGDIDQLVEPLRKSLTA